MLIYLSYINNAILYDFFHQKYHQRFFFSFYYRMKELNKTFFFPNSCNSDFFACNSGLYLQCIRDNFYPHTYFAGLTVNKLCDGIIGDRSPSLPPSSEFVFSEVKCLCDSTVPLNTALAQHLFVFLLFFEERITTSQTDCS